MAKVVVFGKVGQVASALEKEVSEASHKGTLPGGFSAGDWIFVRSTEGNFEKPETVIRILDAHQPKVVVNPAAYTQVDLAETERDKAKQINATTPALIAEWCRRNNASIIHFSTDYVYPGDGEAAWKEADSVGPLNEYGGSKLEGDLRIQQAGCHHIILRTSWVYSAEGKNFVRTMLKLGSEREALGVVTDQIGSPTSAIDLARAVLQIMQHPQFKTRTGVYHYSGVGFVSWYDFAQEIFAQARMLGFPVKVRELGRLTTEQYPSPARRPLNSRLDISRIKKDFDIQGVPWKQALAEVLEELFERDVGR